MSGRGSAAGRGAEKSAGRINSPCGTATQQHRVAARPALLQLLVDVVHDVRHHWGGGAKAGRRTRREWSLPGGIGQGPRRTYHPTRWIAAPAPLTPVVLVPCSRAMPSPISLPVASEMGDAPCAVLGPLPSIAEVPGAVGCFGRDRKLAAVPSG